MDTDTGSVEMTMRRALPDELLPAKDMLLYPLKRDSYMGFFGCLWNKLFETEVINKSSFTDAKRNRKKPI